MVVESAQTHAMICQEFVTRVTDYLERALTPLDQARFEEHLSRCQGCRAYLEQIRQTIQAVGTLLTGAAAPTPGAELLNLFRRWQQP